MRPGHIPRIIRPSYEETWKRLEAGAHTPPSFGLYRKEPSFNEAGAHTPDNTRSYLQWHCETTSVNEAGADNTI